MYTYDLPFLRNFLVLWPIYIYIFVTLTTDHGLDSCVLLISVTVQGFGTYVIPAGQYLVGDDISLSFSAHRVVRICSIQSKDCNYSSCIVTVVCQITVVAACDELRKVR